MNRDAMSVKELFWKIAARDFNTVEDANILLSALRKAVIREASVGTALLSVSSMPKLLWSVTGIKEGRFYLIPKETP